MSDNSGLILGSIIVLIRGMINGINIRFIMHIGSPTGQIRIRSAIDGIPANAQ